MKRTLPRALSPFYAIDNIVVTAIFFLIKDPMTPLHTVCPKNQLSINLAVGLTPCARCIAPETLA